MMTIEQIQERSPYRDKLDITRYPSVMAESPSPKVSDKYKFLSAKSLIPVYAEHNFFPWKITESRAVKDSGNNAFTKHCIDFMNPDMEKSLSPRVGEVFPQISVIGSHDGSARLQQWLKAMRVWCTNGCCTNHDLGGGAVKHLGEDFYADVAQIINNVLQQIPHLGERITSWSNTQLTQDEREVFAQEAITLRYDKDSGVWIDPRELLKPKRVQDRADDLWTTYSVIQEKLTKGGVTAYRRDDNGRYRLRNSGERVRKQGMRGITSVDGDKKLNQALWRLTDAMAKLKRGEVAA